MYARLFGRFSFSKPVFFFGKFLLSIGIDAIDGTFYINGARSNNGKVY